MRLYRAERHLALHKNIKEQTNNMTSRDAKNITKTVRPILLESGDEWFLKQRDAQYKGG